MTIGSACVPARADNVVPVYVPAATVTVSPGWAASTPAWTVPKGDPAVPFPLPPGATNHSVAQAGDATRTATRTSDGWVRMIPESIPAGLPHGQGVEDSADRVALLRCIVPHLVGGGVAAMNRSF